jgi:hypothetical protein
MNKSKHSQLFKIKLAKLSIEELGSDRIDHRNVQYHLHLGSLPIELQSVQTETSLLL